ncbi:MAG: purine-nucleoside phosphorylase [Chloroflexi bacterium]|nr:purine-nucleoside phosphorylase [Chloroflexota bacterium]
MSQSSASPPPPSPGPPDQFEAAQRAAEAVRRLTTSRPQVGIILGSGLGRLAERIEGAEPVSYSDIAGFPRSAVEGHANRLILGHLSGLEVAAMQGRVHFYEGFSASDTAFPVRVLHQLGVRTLIVSNAAGGLDPGFVAGDLMLITDHIFLPGMAGNSPLRGPNDERLGPRFPNMTDAYDGRLREVAQACAAKLDIPLRSGVYAMVAGPSYETPAECRFLRTIGANAVGMSTCAEVVVARHLNMRVLGISLITNVILGQPVDHVEVLGVADSAGGRFCQLVESVVEELSRQQ